MFDEKYMRRAIELAKKGVGAVNPNPLVGAVIVKNDKIIGEGYHKKYGGLHAERDAFISLVEDAEGADMYVTLEPCCHHGKQPPCVEAIVEHKIKNVYVGSDDPNELVSGKGYDYLKKHGINVYTHILKEECDAINDIFFHYITKKTPYVILKYAMTMDGKIAAYTGESKWISNETSRHDSQELRNRCSGIMVGIGTVLADDPMLNCRIEGGHDPIRIICDSNMRIPIDSNIVKSAKDIRTILVVSNRLKSYLSAMELKYNELIEHGIEVIFVDETEGMIDLESLMKLLGEMDIDSVIIEGGGSINYSAVKAGIVNEVMIYLAPKILGGRDSLTAVEGQGFETPDMAAGFKLMETRLMDGDILLRYKSV